MENKLSIIEIVLTVIILIVACFGIWVTVTNRVNGSGQLTTENYTEYMQVDCMLGGGYVANDTLWYSYYITVNAARHYKLENVTISYSLESDRVSLPNGTLTVNVDAGGYFRDKCENKLTVTITDELLGTWDDPTLKIIVTSVTGSYSYSK